jgi:hypothetical protein
MSNRLNARPKGMELFEITPIMLGGHPTDPQNKIWLTRQQHFEIVRYWNHVIRDHSKVAHRNGFEGQA